MIAGKKFQINGKSVSMMVDGDTEDNIIIGLDHKDREVDIGKDLSIILSESKERNVDKYDICVKDMSNDSWVVLGRVEIEK